MYITKDWWNKVASDDMDLSPEQRALFDAMLAKRGWERPREHFLQHDAEHRYSPFPLTDVQKAYLLGRSKSVELGNVASHGYQEFDLDELDIERYEDAWNKVIARHDMLRAMILPDATQRVLASVERFGVGFSD